MDRLTNINSYSTESICKWIPVMPPPTIKSIGRRSVYATLVPLVASLLSRFRPLPNQPVVDAVTVRMAQDLLDKLEPFTDDNADLIIIDLLIGAGEAGVAEEAWWNEQEFMGIIVDTFLWLMLRYSHLTKGKLKKVHSKLDNLYNSLENAGMMDACQGLKTAGHCLDIGWKAAFWKDALEAAGFPPLVDTCNYDDYDDNFMHKQLLFLRQHNYSKVCLDAVGAYRKSGFTVSTKIQLFEINTLMYIKDYGRIGQVLPNVDTAKLVCEEWSAMETLNSVNSIITGAKLTIVDCLDVERVWSSDCNEYHAALGAFNLLITGIEKKINVDLCSEIGVTLAVLLDLCISSGSSSLITDVFDFLKHGKETHNPTQYYRFFEEYLGDMTSRGVDAILRIGDQLYNLKQQQVHRDEIIKLYVEISHTALVRSMQLVDTEEPQEFCFDTIDAQRYKSARTCAMIAALITKHIEETMGRMWLGLDFLSVKELSEIGTEKAKLWFQGCFDLSEVFDIREAYEHLKFFGVHTGYVCDLVCAEEHVRRCDVCKLVWILYKEDKIGYAIDIVRQKRNIKALIELLQFVDTKDSGIKELASIALLEWVWNSSAGVDEFCDPADERWAGADGRVDPNVNRIMSFFDLEWKVNVLRNHCVAAFIGNKIGDKVTGRGSVHHRSKCFDLTVNCIQQFHDAASACGRNQVYKDFMIRFNRQHKVKSLKDRLVNRNLWV